MQELEAERRQWLFRVEATRSRVQAVRHMRGQARPVEHSPPPPLPPPPPTTTPHEGGGTLETPKTALIIEERGVASKYSSRSSRLPPLALRLTKPVLTKPVLTKPVLTKPVLTKPVLTKPAIVKVHHGQLPHVPMTPSRGWRYFAVAD